MKHLNGTSRKGLIKENDRLAERRQFLGIQSLSAKEGKSFRSGFYLLKGDCSDYSLLFGEVKIIM